MGERTGGVGETAGGDGEALADVDGCGVVVHAEQNQRRIGLLVTHGVVNRWTLENWLEAQTARMTKKTKLER